MTFRFDDTWMVATVLLWTRMGALLLSSSLASATKAPATFIILFTLAFSGLLSAALDLQTPMALHEELGTLPLAMLTEALVGTLMGFALQCAIAAFSSAGQLLDAQMGFGIGAILNPVTNARSPVIGSVLSLLAVAYFFAIDAHHALVRGIAFSLDSIPLGQAWPMLTPEAIVRPVGAMFTLMVALAAPTLFVLLLLELASMVASRVLPQMNAYFVVIPAKILIGLVTLALSASLIAPIMGRAYSSVFRYWQAVMR